MVQLAAILKSLNHEGQNNSFAHFDIGNKPADTEVYATDFIGGTNVLVFSGPPLLEQARINPHLIFPVGLITNLGVQVSKRYLPWNEMGEKYTRHIPGKISYSLNMAKIMSNKGDIMWSLYKWLTTTLTIMQKQAQMGFNEEPGHNIKDRGDGKDLTSYNQFHNLASEIFNAPFGLLLVSTDNTFDVQSIEYAQLCKVASKGKQISDSPLIQESVQILCTSILPATGLTIKSSAPTKAYLLADPLSNLYANDDKTGEAVGGFGGSGDPTGVGGGDPNSFISITSADVANPIGRGISIQKTALDGTPLTNAESEALFSTPTTASEYQQYKDQGVVIRTADPGNPADDQVSGSSAKIREVLATTVEGDPVTGVDAKFIQEMKGFGF